MKLSITAAWNQAMAFLKGNFALLYSVALALIAVPTVIFQYVAPDAAPGETAEPGAWMLLIVPLALVGLLGSLAIIVMILRPGSSVGEALSAAMKRMLPAIGALLLLALGVGAVALLVALLAVALAAGLGQTAATMIVFPPLFALLAFIFTRLLLINPVAAMEGIGATGILKRSWRLTEGNFWRLFGFLLLFGLASAVIILAAGGVFGILFTLAFGPPAESELTTLLVLLLQGFLQAAINTVYLAVIAFVYRQLAEGRVSVPASSE
ncbi:MAG: hypothetical protein ACFBQW_02570 [Sphingomonadaceae bacterium]